MLRHEKTKPKIDKIPKKYVYISEEFFATCKKIIFVFFDNFSFFSTHILIVADRILNIPIPKKIYLYFRNCVYYFPQPVKKSYFLTIFRIFLR